VLLLIPLISLIALWAYAAFGTIGPAIAKRNTDTINKDVGGPAQGLLLQLAQEQADTFIWQSAHGLVPRASLDAQRAHTDATVSAFRAGVVAAAAAGAETQATQPEVAALSSKLSQLGTLRAAVDDRTIQPLAAFQSYDGVADAFFPFARGSLASPDGSLPLYQQGEAVIDEAQALELIGREAALVGGALVSGGVMTPAEHQLFVQAVGNQRFLEQTALSSFYWQESPDPYPAVFASPAYRNFRALEDRIAASGGGTRLPVSPITWQATVQSVLAAFNHAETVGRLGVTRGSAHAGDVILLRLFLVGGAGLVAVLASALLLVRFGNRITRELTGFLKAVRALADERLPEVVRRLRRGEDVDVAAEAPPLALRTRTLEVARIADAFSAVQRTAVEAAVSQAELRKGVSGVFRSLARRNQSLLQRQLKMLDAMERGTEEPDALAQLFGVDHLTTRMRRHAEGLIILSGSQPGRGWREPVPMVEVLRGAIGEIEDYARVDVIASPGDQVPGTAVADVTHLLAELIENATLYSPSHTRIQVTASRVASGFAVEIEDRGLGVPPGALATLNDRLANPPEFDLADTDQLGLFVVSRLAARHGIKVTLRGSPFGGITAIVLMPHHLVQEGDPDSPPSAAIAPAGSGRPNGNGGSRGQTPNGYWRVAPAAPSSESNEAGSGQHPVRVWPQPAGEPAAGRTPGEEAGSGSRAPAVEGTYRGMPRRVRQASLAPQLRDDPPARNGAHGAAPADRTRALIASIQRGWRSGRADADRVAGGPATPPADTDTGRDHGRAEP
jgi:signal transduction histidine kinase